MIGFEAFPRRVQPVLERWVAGQLSESEFLAQSDWRNVWRFDVSDANDANWKVEKFATLTDAHWGTSGLVILMVLVGAILAFIAATGAAYVATKVYAAGAILTPSKRPIGATSVAVGISPL